MSVITLFTKKSPTIAGLEFDAVLEDTLEAEVEVTTFPIETGARAADHVIIHPFRWSLIGAMSDNPLKPELTDFIGAITNQVSDSGIASTVAGLSAGLLAGSSNTRSSTALRELLVLMVTAEPFTINAGDISLDNMVIVKISRTKNAANEGGLIFQADLQELPTLDTITTATALPNQSNLLEGDPAQTQATETINKGEIGLTAATASQTASAESVIL